MRDVLPVPDVQRDEAELLGQLPGQGRLQGFAGLHLAPGEFPEAGHGLAFRAPHRQEALPAPDHPRPPPGSPGLRELQRRSSGRTGRRRMKRAPAPLEVSTSMIPLCMLVTMKYETDSPRPVPSPTGLVVKNGSKALRRTASSMPGPLSTTSTRTWSPSARVRRVMTGSGVFARAWAALRRRLSSTCWIWVWELGTRGMVGSNSRTIRIFLKS